MVTKQTSAPAQFPRLLNLPFPKSKDQSSKIDRVSWSRLAGSSKSIAIVEAALHSERVTIVVTENTPQAHKLEIEIRSLTKLYQLPVFTFPDWEILPYDTFSPHQDIISQRLLTLHQLPRLTKGIVIVPVATMLHFIAPKRYIEQNSFIYHVGDTYNINQISKQLQLNGYRNVEQVVEHGEYSLRGSILDIFPMGSKKPFRLDFFDDEIDTIRTFDPDTQRSEDKINNINLLPAHEFPLDKSGIELFRQNYREQFPVRNEKGSLYKLVTEGSFPAGIEYYLPLFFDQVETLFHYFPDNSQLVLVGDIEAQAKLYLSDNERRYTNLNVDPLRPLLPLKSLFLNVNELFTQFKQWPQIKIINEVKTAAGHVNANTSVIDDIAINSQIKQPFTKIIAHILEKKEQNGRVLFSVETAGRRETLLELLKQANIKPTVCQSISDFVDNKSDIGIVISSLEHSFTLLSESYNAISIVTETELLGGRVTQRRRHRKGKSISTDALVRNLAELNIGQPIVHIEHGVGRYLGLQTIDAGGLSSEFVSIEYSNAAKLYVPVGNLHLLSRYSGGDSDTAPLNKLGSDAWEKARKKAAEKIKDVAAELLDIYAQRAAKPGYKYDLDKDSYRQFSASFPFEETDDQQQAISAVISDMRSPNAMDRLVCGDVGFGKTEVAMRATFVAVNDSKQVAVLVPTTLLAQQHFENFVDRFADWPIKVEVLSRFKTGKQQTEILKQLENGTIDIIVGTHKLIQENIKFKDLGLLVIDEEHRFGVKQKDAIKKLRANVDILTLTATPIPRTLNMAMSGMRDLSIIATPPKKRLAVKTFVRPFDMELIKESILRETSRGGQVYFLHNNVETIEQRCREIEALLPDIRITFAHGQMRERELERVMSDFYHQRYNVIVCTTIIETGIDVPTANTIIMERADRLGLAQLHQLRGRVGRSHHQAYAYLLTPPPKSISKDAVKRLEAIEQLEDLGAGFALATHDLEIRGAGELLGDDQHGQIQTIGFTLYMDMLEHAVEALKQGKELSLDALTSKQTEVELRLPSLLPDSYIPEVNLRLSLYKRIATCSDVPELDDIKIELIDRFGLLPDATKNLFRISEFRQRAQAIGITKIEAGPKGGSIEFAESTSVDPIFLISLIQQHPDTYKLDGGNKLKFAIENKDAEDRLKFVNSLLNDFEHKVKPT
ncbi:transcription-repair coupling factor [Psychrosphaera sp. B3R10]|uniref:transcription-repair coupling factor n=1 Tax=unclassified Psychrosphaera TaxID=2641570 RepID=UPI001C092845|nr:MULTISPECIES: transcription-repair coupling factor [unclassified Psychrosphaera]MBU2881343.1 transcription-repair coupling factor [Psychrosphaera sp. I2R16]MBU2988442.1 transcription-repair coupling factor [Psychrosphaera sp. B3R10]